MTTLAPRDPSAPAAASAAGLSWSLIVCGGRDYDDAACVRRVLNGLAADHGSLPLVLRHGNATGADTLADFWASARGVTRAAYPANFYPNGKLDRSAGPRRNAVMLAAAVKEGAPVVVVAFPSGRGTADMVRKAKAAGVPVVEVPA